jgi:type VI secretion system secreted protein VgrG
MTAPVTFNCPLPADTLRFESLAANQGVSVLDAVELQLLSDKPDIQAEDLLGKPAGVEVLLREGGKRHINGLVTRFGMGRSKGRWFRYQATLRPWLWLLTLSNDCRVFQDQTVREIVEAVFADHGAYANFEFKLFRSYRKRVYCVQYRESAYNFVARLLEEEGIYWYFEHQAGQHKLVLVDDISALAAADGAEKFPYYDNTGQRPPDVDVISAWAAAREVRTGKLALTSYDFERPSSSLAVEQQQPRQHDHDDLEVFDFEGDYTQQADGQHIADVRLEEQQAGFERLSGQTTSHGLMPGYLFTLERHPRAACNAEYLCLNVTLSLRVAPHESAQGADHFECSFGAMPSAQAFRPPRRTPKPFVQGPQTAVVVGPSGEEIHTDKYGRVKVQFHWDRKGRKNEKSSCWVRVSSPWAGKSFGFIQIPRIGQEVIVDFLEGDPDQPIITGRVYNAEQMPPWELPANATQSGVLTRSSKGGAYGNANALRFEDKKGSEQLWIHAEKNQDIEVENDETHWVGHDRTKTIDHDETTHVKHDRTETVDNNETVSIGVNRSMTIGQDKSESVGRNKVVDVGSNLSETIGAAMSLTVGSTLTETVAVNHSEAVGGAMEITVGAAMAITVGAGMAEAVGAAKSSTVGGSLTTSVGSSSSLTVGTNLNEDVGGSRLVKIKKDHTVKVDGQQVVEVAKEATLKAKKVLISAEDEIILKTGSAEIIMKKNGDITIKGNKINVKGSGDVVIKGSKVTQN